MNHNGSQIGAIKVHKNSNIVHPTDCLNQRTLIEYSLNKNHSSQVTTNNSEFPAAMNNSRHNKFPKVDEHNTVVGNGITFE